VVKAAVRRQANVSWRLVFTGCQVLEIGSDVGTTVFAPVGDDPVDANALGA